MLSLEVQVVGGPGLDQQVFGLLQLLRPQVRVGAEADVLVGVVVGPPGGTDDYAAPGQVVQQGGLDGHAHRIVQGQFQDAETDVHPLDVFTASAPANTSGSP